MLLRSGWSARGAETLLATGIEQSQTAPMVTTRPATDVNWCPGSHTWSIALVHGRCATQWKVLTGLGLREEAAER